MALADGRQPVPMVAARRLEPSLFAREARRRASPAKTIESIVSRLIHLFAHDLLPHPTLKQDVDLTPRSVSDLLRAGRCPSEAQFDTFLPVEHRVVSWQYWTPLVVVLRAATWLNDNRVRSVVDIGSGAGKFCVAAALASQCRFTGIEHRPRLISTARQLAKTFEVDDRVTFIDGVFGEATLPEADLYYMYNPFGENIFDRDCRLDDHVELSAERYERDTTAATDLLNDAKVGTYLLTYNGFGGSIPAGYKVVQTDLELPNVLRLWRKVSASAA
jgi:predicted RNA methylase